MRLLNYIFIALIWFYQKTLSPSTGILRAIYNGKQVCIYYPTCSEYAKECFKKYSFFKAFAKSVKRVLSCRPGKEPKVDLP